MHALETKTLSPRDLAEIVGVSESSIKRWVDDGLIAVTRTAGGHRRIRVGEAMRFIRERRMPVLRPEVLGLPDLESLPAEARTGDLTGDVLFHLLKSERARQARGVLAAAFLSGRRMADLFDGPIAEALTRLGELWLRDPRGIFLEHRATAVVFEAINQIRLLLPPPPDDAPVVLGGTPPGDPYLLPTLTAATVLAEAGFRDLNLGPETPARTFCHAVAERRPRLVWIAVMTKPSPAVRDELHGALLPVLREAAVDVVVGGRHSEALRPAEAVHFLGSMTELEAFVA